MWWIVVVFFLIVVLMTFGVRQASRFAGRAVGRSTLRLHRVAEMIYSTGRIPRSWVSDELARGGPKAEQHARDDAQWEIDKLIKHFTKSGAFADEESRAELMGALESTRDRLEREPLDDLIGPDPRLRRTVVFLDSGDTLVDEGTEIKDENKVTQRARLIPGAARMVRRLKQTGYTIALVADGPRGTFENTLKPPRLWQLFDAYAISGDVGVGKPDPRMFRTALDELEIPEAEYRDVVMVGNNLFRDIKGANDLGLTTVWLDWAPRRSKTPADESEVPDYTIGKPMELIEIVERLEAEREQELEAEAETGEEQA